MSYTLFSDDGNSMQFAALFGSGYLRVIEYPDGETPTSIFNQVEPIVNLVESTWGNLGCLAVIPAMLSHKQVTNAAVSTVELHGARPQTRPYTLASDLRQIGHSRFGVSLRLLAQSGYLRDAAARVRKGGDNATSHSSLRGLGRFEPTDVSQSYRFDGPSHLYRGVQRTYLTGDRKLYTRYQLASGLAVQWSDPSFSSGFSNDVALHDVLSAVSEAHESGATIAAAGNLGTGHYCECSVLSWSYDGPQLYQSGLAQSFGEPGNKPWVEYHYEYRARRTVWDAGKPLFWVNRTTGEYTNRVTVSVYPLVHQDSQPSYYLASCVVVVQVATEGHGVSRSDGGTPSDHWLFVCGEGSVHKRTAWPMDNTQSISGIIATGTSTAAVVQSHVQVQFDTAILHKRTPELQSVFADSYHKHRVAQEARSHNAYALTQAFGDLVSAQWQSLRPMLSYAAADAAATELSTIRQNHLETLSELSQVQALVGLDAYEDFLKELGRLLSDVKGRRFVRACERVLDLVTSTDLALKFGVRPLAQSVGEVVEKADQVYAKLAANGGFAGSKTLYGKFVYELPDGLQGFPVADPCRLTARAKLRTSIGLTDFVGTVLGLRTLGILPVFSGFYELIPFSFVADWKFNIGERLSDLEQSYQLSFLNLEYACYSLLCEQSIVSESIYLGQPNGGRRELVPLRETQLRHFVRMPSVVWPELSDSALYDFRAPSMPDVGTAGSLIFQVFGK